MFLLKGPSASFHGAAYSSPSQKPQTEYKEVSKRGLHAISLVAPYKRKNMRGLYIPNNELGNVDAVLVCNPPLEGWKFWGGKILEGVLP